VNKEKMQAAGPMLASAHSGFGAAPHIYEVNRVEAADFSPGKRGFRPAGRVPPLKMVGYFKRPTKLNSGSWDRLARRAAWCQAFRIFISAKHYSGLRAGAQNKECPTGLAAVEHSSRQSSPRTA